METNKKPEWEEEFDNKKRHYVYGGYPDSIREENIKSFISKVASDSYNRGKKDLGEELRKDIEHLHSPEAEKVREKLFNILIK